VIRPNRGLPDATVKIDLNKVRRLGIDVSSPQLVGCSFNMLGGRVEVIMENIDRATGFDTRYRSHDR
jgi:hypothetical protein